MARFRRYEAAEDSNPALDISSLIDVCFLLLIYFLVTSTLKPRESDLRMALPAATPTTEMPKIEPMYIKIDQTGAIFAGVGDAQQPMDSDAEVRDLPLLSSQLKLYKDGASASNTTPLVQVHVDGETVQQRVIDVLNALAAVEITSVTFTDLLD